MLLFLLLMGAASGAAHAQTNVIIDFLGQRFAPARGFQAAEALAFDVNSEHLAGFPITDRCGTPVLKNFGGAGTHWDAVLDKYWYVSPEGIVGTYVGSALNSGTFGTQIDTLFTLPPTVDIPGIGALDLVSPRGIAVDAQHVYIVTAGPVPGDPTSGGWFKFTRNGTPVSSSLATDFNAHLVADPDALVDGICRIPDTAPFGQGLFLVALEHSGIVVIDENGFFVDDIRWSQLGIVDDPAARTMPTAFAGITIDPQTGNIFLADNDRTLAQVWVRLPEQSVPRYILGSGPFEVWLHHPSTGCNFPLWRTYVPSGPFGDPPPLLFGIAYRPADGLVYGFGFNSGDLLSLDPRNGARSIVASSILQNAWGMAYDSERDVFYASKEVPGGNHIYVVEPGTWTATPLPFPVGHALTDLAFNPQDQSIYGVSFFSGSPFLVRINRDDGQGVFTGQPTQAVAGLTYDPSSGKLIGRGNGPELWSIDPATGAAQVLSTLSNSVGWEGLAAVFEGPSVTAASPAVQPGGSSLVMRIAPNPFQSRTQLSFEVPRGGRVEAAIFDVAGRLVRRLRGGGAWAAGPTVLSWDGRDAHGRRVASGTYLVRAYAAGRTGSVKVVMTR